MFPTDSSIEFVFFVVFFFLLLLLIDQIAATLQLTICLYEKSQGILYSIIASNTEEWKSNIFHYHDHDHHHHHNSNNNTAISINIIRHFWNRGDGVILAKIAIESRILTISKYVADKVSYDNGRLFIILLQGKR